LAGDEALLNELRAQTQWLRLLGLQTLRPLLVEILANTKQKFVYEATDGNRTTRQVGEIAGVSPGTVSVWWTKWIAAGICIEAPGSAGRAKHLASLSSLGIEVPTPAGASPMAEVSKYK
jgi:hypothetical protein